MTAQAQGQATAIAVAGYLAPDVPRELPWHASYHPDGMIVEAARRLIEVPDPRVIERWIGIYPSADTPVIIEAPHPDVRVVVIAGGSGMSAAFAVAEEVIGKLLAPEDWTATDSATARKMTLPGDSRRR